jgi:pteridine reductase
MPANKVALVTGSGKRRVGSHVAETLGDRGYAVVVHYRTSVAEAAELTERLKAQHAEAIAIQADLTDETAVRGMVEQVMNRFGRIDVLVTAAAIWERKRLEEVTAADVRRHFETNALGTFLCAQQVGLIMCGQSEGGLIVTLGDWAEARPYLDFAAYFPSKGAVSTMTRSLAVELASRNPKVRVNCLLPGPVLLRPGLSAAQQSAVVRSTLVKRVGSPAHIAQAVLGLIDNDFITGVCLPVDGGRTVFSCEPE